ncbi:MAG: dihydroorotate dehydrogenase electron transfer subunit [Oscillospiraceae bacterium]|jgi:dihydroorotate dehydrogenase electron transfer subunit|nr:dihydroorotate dehydrogenase electron transfer subunit [Oscillospiraceae bacterium]
MYKCGVYPVTEKTEISAGIYSYVISCPDVAELAKPGQFAHIKVDGFTLRRPVSICDADKEKGSLRVVFEVRGKGTARLADINVGDKTDIIAPLGNGFTLPESMAPGRRVILAGGGIGVPPLLGVARVMKGNATAILGFKSRERIILAEDFRRAGAEVIICTDDGSAGVRGTVADVLRDESVKGGADGVFACGPEPMLKAVVGECKKSGLNAEVSLEQRMGCGVGACLVCVCRAVRGGEEFMLRVCKDGPVFNGREVMP